jgi:hypothetical protein
MTLRSISMKGHEQKYKLLSPLFKLFRYIKKKTTLR